MEVYTDIYLHGNNYGSTASLHMIEYNVRQNENN